MIKLLKLKWPGVFTGHRRQDEVMMNWRFRQPRLGDRVAKAFDGIVFHGEVVKYFQADEDDGENAHVCYVLRVVVVLIVLIALFLRLRCLHCLSLFAFSFFASSCCPVYVVFAVSFACYQ